MKLVAFRIASFRSIIDTYWIKLSPDGITAFVGQNESGKSSILEALQFALSGQMPNEDDMRVESPAPSVILRVEVETEWFESGLDEFFKKDVLLAKESVAQGSGAVDIKISWNKNADTLEMERTVTLDRQRVPPSAISELKESLSKTDQVEAAISTNTGSTPFTTDMFADFVWSELPLGVLFNEESGRLPNSVDLNEKGLPTGRGERAAQAFLAIADIDLPKLLQTNKRTIASTMARANVSVTADFASFWSQTIGGDGRLTLKCELANYDSSVPEKVGKAHLVFWIIDGENQLYPKQRSQGVRWFLSFYLQLKAAEKRKASFIFLLDEPGANLHSKAQSDVLRLMNNLAKSTALVIYTTHSQDLIEYERLYRVHAVQREGDKEGNPTQIISAHHLGTASTDTLSPVLNAMGASFAHNSVIKRHNNILLEEMSGYYYLDTFWKITNQEKSAYFIAATGVNKIEQLANMFIGWGLDFITVIDDDKQGREVAKSMTNNIYGENIELAKEKIYRLSNFTSIEDVFSVADFIKFVLPPNSPSYTLSNGEYVRTNGISKPLLAYQFAIKCRDGAIKFGDFDNFTKTNIDAIQNAIQIRLS